MTTKDEIIEGIKSGKYDIDYLKIFYDKNDMPQTIFSGLFEGITQNEKCWFDMKQTRDTNNTLLKINGVPISEIKVFFVVRKDENDSHRISVAVQRGSKRPQDKA